LTGKVKPTFIKVKTSEINLTEKLKKVSHVESTQCCFTSFHFFIGCTRWLVPWFTRYAVTLHTYIHMNFFFIWVNF